MDSVLDLFFVFFLSTYKSISNVLCETGLKYKFLLKKVESKIEELTKLVFSAKSGRPFSLTEEVKFRGVIPLKGVGDTVPVESPQWLIGNVKLIESELSKLFCMFFNSVEVLHSTIIIINKNKIAIAPTYTII